MGKTKKKKTATNLISTAADSAGSKELKDILFEFEGQISKLENQLRESEVQKNVEIAAALETGKKEGYILGCQKRLDVARQAVDIAGDTSHRTSATFTNTKTPDGPALVLSIAQLTHMPRDMSALCSGQLNPWASLSRRHRRSHPRSSSVCLPPKPFYCVTDSHNLNSVTPPSLPIRAIETVQHPHRIGVAKPVI